MLTRPCFRTIRRGFVLLASMLMATLLVAISPQPAQATPYCETIPYDCTNPNTTCAQYTATTAKTKWTDAGTLELRYRYTCRTIWARIRYETPPVHDLYVKRLTGPLGNTSGLFQYYNYPSRWSRQLNDAGYSGRAQIVTDVTVYWTASY